jgi:hypothetical protein
MSERLNEIQIPSPCPVAWEWMTGDDRVRHCSQCNCNVYDISALPAAEGERLLDRTAGGLCVQISRRSDGSVVTADAPLNARSEPNRRTFGRWMFLSVASLFGLAGCERESSNRSGGEVAPGEVRPGGAVAPTAPPLQVLRGEVSIEPLRGKVVAPPAVRGAEAMPAAK